MSQIPYMRCYTVDLVYHIASNGVFLLQAALSSALPAYSVFFIGEAAVFERGRFSAGERFFKVSRIRQQVARNVDSFKNSVQIFLRWTIRENDVMQSISCCVPTLFTKTTQSSFFFKWSGFRQLDKLKGITYVWIWFNYNFTQAPKTFQCNGCTG